MEHARTSNDSVNPAKERNGLVSYSINGILGLSSETDLRKDLCGQLNSEQEAEEQGKRLSNMAVRDVSRTLIILALLFAFQERTRI